MDNNILAILGNAKLNDAQKYELLMGQSAYAGEMSALDRAIGAYDPALGITLLTNKEYWYAADKQSDKDSYHQTSEYIRNQYLNGNYFKWAGEAAQRGYDAAVLDAKTEAQLRSLKSAYDANVSALQNARTAVTGQYDDARRSVSSGAEIKKQALGEYSAARGLGLGAQTAGRLSIDNAELSDVGALTRDETQKKAELDLKFAELESKYTNDIAAELSRGNYTKAQSLYNDFVKIS